MGLLTAGPAHFGYDVDWIPVEDVPRTHAPSTTEGKAA
jgi:hypothetical protein